MPEGRDRQTGQPVTRVMHRRQSSSGLQQDTDLAAPPPGKWMV